MDKIIGDLEKRFSGAAIYSRYDEKMKYKQSFIEFMNSINEYDLVLTIVSDQYLKSQACMYEVGEVVKNYNFRDRLLFIVVSEKDKKYYGHLIDEQPWANIYNLNERIKYVNYWEDKYAELHKSVETINSEESQLPYREKLKAIRKIIDFDLNTFLDYLADSKGVSISELYQLKFAPIHEFIIPSKIGNKLAESTYDLSVNCKKKVGCKFTYCNSHTEVLTKVEKSIGGKDCLLWLDLDGFTKINEIYGSYRADMVIKMICILIEEVVKEKKCLLYHVNHRDEFFIITNKDDGKKLGNKIIEEVTNYNWCMIGEQNMYLSCSIGLCERKGKEKKLNILKKARMGLNLAKANGGRTIGIYVSPKSSQKLAQDLENVNLSVS